MNQHDSERIGEMLRREGRRSVSSPETADVVIVNTCSVRAKAEQKLRSQLGRLARLKRRQPGLVLCVVGCVAEQEGRRLVASVPEIDVVAGPDRLAELPALVAGVEAGGPPQVRTGFDLEPPRFLPARPEPGRTGATAYVTVMKGCNERCSYCVVPRTRGPGRYRPSAEILDEVTRLVGAGVKEVTLLGQTVNSYRDPAGALPPAPGAGEQPWRWTSRARARQDQSELGALLRALCTRVPGLQRLRYTAPHPRFVDAALIEAHRDLPELAGHVHLPVQSGSDRVLKRMIRRHTVAEYEERVERLRAAVPALTLSTDTIVGFPGETRDDLRATAALLQRVGVVGMFGFMYSVRPGTSALSLGDDVPPQEKSERLAELFAVSDALRLAHLRALVGTVQQVLVEGRGPDGRLSGRTGRNEIVHFDSTDDLTGRMVDVRIVAPFKHSLAGELEREAPAQRALEVV